MLRLSYLVLTAFLLFTGILSAAPRVAVLPSFTNMGYEIGSRRWLAAFDAGVQAELLATREVEVVTRAGASAVVFEQKLAAAAGGDAGPPRIASADFLAVSVLDATKKEVRVHLIPVGDKMVFPKPKVLKYADLKSLAATLPREAAAYLGKYAKLELRKPAAEKAAASVPGKKIVCALLGPIESHGRKDRQATMSPLIRAVIEQSLADGEFAAELVDRENMAALVGEQELAATQEWNANSVSRLAGMVKAELILTPYVLTISDEQVRTILFAVDPDGGRIVAAASWTGAPTDSPPSAAVSGLLREAVDIARQPHDAIDNPASRHTEAKFLNHLGESLDSLRDTRAGDAEVALGLLDAQMGLAHDNQELLRQGIIDLSGTATAGVPYEELVTYAPSAFWANEFLGLRKSGQLEVIQNHARRILELPLRELVKTGERSDRRLLANFYLRTGRPDEARQTLLAGGLSPVDLREDQGLSVSMAYTLVALRQYKEAFEFITSRPDFIRYSSLTNIAIDALRASDRRGEEFELMQRSRRFQKATADDLARWLELGVDQGKAGLAVSAFTSNANGWHKYEDVLRIPLVKARIAAGQKERAISEAQCAFAGFHRKGDRKRADEVAAILKTLDVKPLERLASGAEYLDLPEGIRLDLLHDQRIEPEQAVAVARHLATFWGCPVHVKSIHLDVTRLSTYEPLTTSVQAEVLAEDLVALADKSGPVLDTIFLTGAPLRSRTANYTGNIYSTGSTRYSLKLLSDYYFRNLKGFDKRPLDLVTAMAAANLSFLGRGLWQLAPDATGEKFSPPPPDLFAPNGKLHMADFELGISPGTGALLRSVSAEDWLELANICRAEDQELLAQRPPGELAQFREIAAQIAAALPVIVQPEPSAR